MNTETIERMTFLTSNTKEAAALATVGVKLQPKDPFCVVKKSRYGEDGRKEQKVIVTYQFEGNSETFNLSAKDLHDAYTLQYADKSFNELVTKIRALAGVAQNTAAETGNVEALQLIAECKKLVDVFPYALMVYIRKALENREILARFVNEQKDTAQNFIDVEKINGDRLVAPVTISRENLSKLK